MKAWRLFALLGIALSFPASATTSGFRFDSNTSIGLDGYIDDIVVRTNGKSDQEIHDAIESQLFYLIGALNQYKSAADLGHAEVKLKSSEPVHGTDFADVHYSVKLLVGWDKSTTVPTEIPLVLPARLDDDGKQAFYDKYHETCVEDPNDSDLNVVSYYYYYRPEQDGCELLHTHLNPDLAVSGTMTFRSSELVTSGKYPEYDKVWEDGRLVATLIFGTNKVGATGNGDAGIAAYNQMYRKLKARFGAPSSSNVDLWLLQVPGHSHPDVEMKWDLDGGKKLEVNLLLIDKETLQDVDDQFAAKYNELSQHSDYISYNGHSGFGENIQALTKMGTFVKGQYQLFLINGCDTFFYVDDSLRAAHETVNPGSSPYKYFDIITNALPSPFAAEADNNMAILEAMIGKDKTYHQILSAFDSSQHAIVTGEEDNRFPLPF